MLIGNLMSSFAVSYIAMPYYVNPLLKHWLRPPPDVPIAKTNRRGAAIVVAALTVCALIFYLMTRVFWHLP
jgi:hypothetical protein